MTPKEIHSLLRCGLRPGIVRHAARWVTGLTAAAAISLAAGCAHDPVPARLTGSTASAGVTSTATGPVRAVDNRLLSAARAEVPQVLDSLKRFVEVDSASGFGAGLAKMADVLEADLKTLGMNVERLSAAPAAGSSLVGRLRGTGKTRILMMAHMDIVFPPGVAASKPFRIEGNRAYGPGIADDKGGLAVVVHSIRLLRTLGFGDFGELVVLFNPDEERGSLGSRDLIRKLAAEVDYVLSFEPTIAARESLVLATSGTAAVNVTIRGKASHAGGSPELGVNALTEMADLMLRTQDLDDKARGIRFNWTMAKGGETRNIIPELATMGADMRYLRNEDAQTTLQELRRRIESKRLPDAQIELNVIMGRPAFQAGAGGRALIDRARGIYRELDRDLNIVAAIGGGTDASYAALDGTPVIESLGLPGAGFHTTEDEYIAIDRIANRLYLTVRMIQDLAGTR